MHHVGEVVPGKFTGRPFHAQCSCGTAGDFAQQDDAVSYLTNHFARLQGINSAELKPVAKEEPKAPEPKSVPPKPEPAKPAEKKP
jgi:hypothetical protein